MSDTQDDSQAGAKQPPVFTKQSRAKDVRVSLSWPAIYPGVTFAVVFDLAMSDEADKIRQAYLGKPQAERRETQHEHNVEMFAHLLNSEPEGFGDFPAPQASYEDEKMRRADLTVRATAYFGERDEDDKFVMGWFVDQAMGYYYSAVMPQEYL